MNTQTYKKAWVLAVFILLPLTLSRGVTLPAGTPVIVALKADLSSDSVQEGQRLEFEVAEPVLVNGVVVIPKGSLAWGGIQESKAGGGRLRGRSKEVKFDVEAVRLPDMRVVKLRSTREHKDYDVIKVTSEFGTGVGAPKGTTYTVYLDADFEAGAPVVPATSSTPISVPPPGAKPEVSPALPVTPAPAVVTPPVPAAPTPSPATPVAPQPAVKQPPSESFGQPAPATQPAVVHPASPARAADMTFGPSTEWITVECFSTPAGAEILIDGTYYGNTQSIIKVPAGDHQLQFALDGYKPYDVALYIPAGSAVRTIRKDLESLNPQ